MLSESTLHIGELEVFCPLLCTRGVPTQHTTLDWFVEGMH